MCNYIYISEEPSLSLDDQHSLLEISCSPQGRIHLWGIALKKTKVFKEIRVGWAALEGPTKGCRVYPSSIALLSLNY